MCVTASHASLADPGAHCPNLFTSPAPFWTLECSAPGRSSQLQLLQKLFAASRQKLHLDCGSWRPQAGQSAVCACTCSAAVAAGRGALHEEVPRSVGRAAAHHAGCRVQVPAHHQRVSNCTDNSSGSASLLLQNTWAVSPFDSGWSRSQISPASCEPLSLSALLRPAEALSNLKFSAVLRLRGAAWDLPACLHMPMAGFCESPQFPHIPPPQLPLPRSIEEVK